MRFLAWHLGLGDAIAFADLAVRIADGEPLLVPVLFHNEDSVESLFIDHPNINFGFFDSGASFDKFVQDTDYELIRLGHYSGIPRTECEDMIEWIYRTAGINPVTRWEDDVVFKASKSVRRRTIGTALSWYHEDTDRGFVIDRSRVPGGCHQSFGNNGESILRYVWLIRSALRIDCIDSAFLHLVEQLQPTGKLFYHKYARPNSEAYRTLRHQWTVLE